MREPTDKPDESPPEKNQAAAELGRRGGKKGGAARAARMTPEERADAARLAAQARWARTTPEERRTRNPDGEPFTFVLNPAEIAQIIGTPISGGGGLQSFQKMLREQLAHGPVVKLDNAQLGRLIRYMTYPRGGGFEDRLRRAFADSFLHLFTPIFEAERR